MLQSFQVLFNAFFQVLFVGLAYGNQFNLHQVSISTGKTPAAILLKKSSNATWNSFVKCFQQLTCLLKVFCPKPPLPFPEIKGILSGNFQPCTSSEQLALT